MTPEQENELLETVKKTGWKMDILVSDDLKTGKVPDLEVAHQNLKLDVNSQISFYKGAIAVISFVILVFGAVFAEHVLRGK